MAKKTVEAKLKRQLKNANRKLKQALPHDPDCANDMRAARARAAIAAYRDLTGAKRKNAVSKVICDLMHLYDRDNCSVAFRGGSILPPNSMRSKLRNRSLKDHRGCEYAHLLGSRNGSTSAFNA